MLQDELVRIKDDMRVLADKPLQNLVDFCQLASTYLEHGPNVKLIQLIAHKLAADHNSSQSAVDAFLHFVIQCATLEVTEEQFRQSLLFLGLDGEEVHDQVYHNYVQQIPLINRYLAKSSIQHWHLRQLLWRFQAQVSSRSLHFHIKPRVILKLELVKGGQTKSIWLESDVANLIHMTSVLTEACQQLRSQHVRRIHRLVN